MGELRKDRRRYLTQDELVRLITAAKQGRYGQRDATLILIMARHGLRVSEAIDLEWDQVDFTRAHIHVRRLKGGIASVHPIQGDELRALRELRRATEGAFVFASERGGPMTRSNVAKIIEAAGNRAGVRAHPHMLRHTCGHLLADAGHDTRRLQLWLGHKEHKAHGALFRTINKRLQGVLEMNEIMITKDRSPIIGICARRIARKAVQQELRDEGVRVSLVRPAEINQRATAYIAAHPEIWAQAVERARRIEELEEARKAARRKVRL